MHLSFGTEDWARQQRELQQREATLTEYALANAALTTSQLVKGYVAAYPETTGFHFTDPNVPLLYFKISDWRETVPRVVVSFGRDNNIVFNSTNMAVEQID